MATGERTLPPLPGSPRRDAAGPDDDVAQSERAADAGAAEPEEAGQRPGGGAAEPPKTAEAPTRPTSPKEAAGAVSRWRASLSSATRTRLASLAAYADDVLDRRFATRAKFGLSISALGDELAWRGAWAELQPWRAPAAAALVAAVVSPRAAVLVAAVAVGVAVGLFIAPLARPAAEARRVGDLAVVWKEDVRYSKPASRRRPPPLPDILSPSLLAAVDTLISYFVRDFIRSWWDHMGNIPKPPDFVDNLRRALEHAAATGAALSKATPAASVMIPVANALVSHLRQYRLYEQSALNLPAFVLRSPSSPLARFATPQLVEQHLASVAQLVVSRTIPEDEAGPTAMALVRASVSLFVLLQATNGLADPDYFNTRIVELLSPSSPAPKHRRKPPPLASVFVRVVEARRLGLPASVAQVYCTVRVGGEEQRTQKVLAEGHPVWDWEGWFEYREGEGRGEERGLEGVLVDVWARGGLQDSILSSVWIPFATHPPNTLHKKHHPLTTAHLASSLLPATAHAELHVEFVRADPDAPIPGVGTVGGHLGGAKSLPALIDAVRRGRWEEEEDPVTPPQRAYGGTRTPPVPTPRASTDAAGMPALALRDLLSGDMLDALLSHLQASHPAQMPLLGFLLDLEALDGLPPAAAASDGERIFSAHFGPGSRMAGLVESGVIARIREGLALGEPGVWEEARRWAAEVLERECLLRCEVVPGYRYVREGPRRGASAEGRAGGGGEAAIAEDLAGVLARSAGALPGPVPRRRTTPGPTPRGSRAGSPSRGVVPGAVAVLDPAGTPRSSTDSNPSVPTDPAEARKRMGVLQEQIAAVQDAAIRILRTDPGSSRLAQLKRTKNSMEAELARVKRVVEDADGQLTPSRILFGAQVRVRDLEGPRDEEAGAGSAWTLQRLKETFVTAGAGIAPAAAARAAGRAIVYSVEVSSRGTAMRHGWAITRRWSDFVLLQEKLASQHAKVSKIGFPTRQRLTSETDAEARARLAGELERFLSTLLIDSKLCESFVLQTFLQPELVNFEEALDNGGSELEHPLAVFADAFRSVGTGVTEAASLIGLGVNEAVSAVSSFGSGAASVVGAGVGAVGSGVVGAVKAPISAAGSLLKGMTSSKAGQSSQEAARGIGKQNSFSSQLMGTFGGFTGAANGPADPFSSRPASNSSSTVPSPSRTPTVVPASQATAMEQALAPAGSGSGASTPSRSTAEYVRSSGSIGDKPPEDMYNVDPDLVLDLAFSLLEEVFDVAAVRQTSLNIIKSVLRQTHRETIRMAASRLIYAVAHDDSVAAQIQGILARFWPDGIFYAHNPNFVPPPVRTPEQREATKLEAKRLLMQDSDPFGIMLTLDRLVGRYARVMGLIRLFNCLQSDEGLLNKGLICAVLEVVAKALLVGVEEVREAEVVERPDRAYGAKQAKGADMAL